MLIASLVAYLFSPSNLPNCIPSSGYFVNEVAFLLLFCMICHIAERCACPSEALSCLLDHDQHFVERDRGLCTAIWNIAIVWLASILSGREKKPDKMDSRCGQSTKLNVDYFVCASVCFKICHSLSIFEETIIGKLNL